MRGPKGGIYRLSATGKKIYGKLKRHHKAVGGSKTALAKDWARHSALNLGEAVRHASWLTDHPSVHTGNKKTYQHKLASVKKRLPLVASSLYYAALPPQTHHSPRDLVGLRPSKVGFRQQLAKNYKKGRYIA